MKKTVVLLLTFICVCSFCINTYASNEQTTFSVGNIEIVFSDESTLTYAQRNTIVEHLVQGSSNIQTYGLICNLFGHKNTTEFVTTITHCANITSPRCLEECWEVTICSRCENTETTRLTYYFIDCCPED